jgi:DNA-3-methyladenine glycosylase
MSAVALPVSSDSISRRDAASLGLPTVSTGSVGPNAVELCEGRSVAPTAQTLRRGFYDRPAPLVAANLIGKVFSYGLLSGRIVEVEAYDEKEPASHGFSGRRKSNETLFGPPGRLEVYLSYGINYLANVVCQPVGVGSGILIRALEPLTGLDLMRANRGDPKDPDRRLCSGPGRLCKAFGLSRADNDTDLVVGEVRILDDRVALPYVRSPRVGVSAGQDLDWRFYVAGNPSVSVRAPTTHERAATSSPVLKSRSSQT